MIEALESRIAPATFIVTSLADNGADGTLRHEVQDANLSPGADTLIFKIPAAYLPGTITLAGAEILIADALTIKGPGVDVLTLSGGGLSRIFDIDEGTDKLAPVAISNLTFSEGKSFANGDAIFSVEPLALKNVVVRSSHALQAGGGVYVETAGKVSISGSQIVNNVADQYGGGMVLECAGASVTKTTIADNTAKYAGGLTVQLLGTKPVFVFDGGVVAGNKSSGGAGGMGLSGVDDGNLTVKNSLFTGNTAATAGGGLVCVGGSYVVSNNTFSNNSAQSEGGALWELNSKSLAITGSRFLSNNVTGAAGGGGAIGIDGGIHASIAGSLFSGNTSADRGGAIAVISGSTNLTLAGSAFLGNTATTTGGAIDLGGVTALTMSGSSLSGNTADGAGGAIYATGSDGLHLKANKLTENRAPMGGALYLSGNSAADQLSGNLFQGNFAAGAGGAVYATDASVFKSKSDKFLGNVASTGQGGGAFLANSGGIKLAGSLFQSNVAAGSGGGMVIQGDATITGVKVLGNIAGVTGRGGGIRIFGGNVKITTSVVTGNLADEGGGIFYNAGTATLDAATVVTGNTALITPNIGHT